MAATAKDLITVTCKLNQCLVKEEKNKSDAMIITKFAGIALPGAFKKFNADLEQVIFNNRCWTKIETGKLDGSWIMQLNDPKSGEQIVDIKDCTINNLKVKVGKESAIEVTVVVRHNLTKCQGALEAAVSTTVLLSLALDKSVLNTTDEEPVKA